MPNIIIHNTIPMAQVSTDFILPLYTFPLLLQYLSDDQQSNIGDEIEDYDKNLK
jgi:hypothetical protein